MITRFPSLADRIQSPLAAAWARTRIESLSWGLVALASRSARRPDHARYRRFDEELRSAAPEVWVLRATWVDRDPRVSSPRRAQAPVWIAFDAGPDVLRRIAARHGQAAILHTDPEEGAPVLISAAGRRALPTVQEGLLGHVFLTAAFPGQSIGDACFEYLPQGFAEELLLQRPGSEA